jgi:serine protease Do
MKSFLQFLLFVLLITMALAGLYAWKSGQSGNPPPTPESTHALPAVKPAVSASRVPGLAALDEELARVSEAVLPSVVSISAVRGATIDPREELIRQLFGLGRPASPQPSSTDGSGVIVSAEGHIVTNLHVIEGAERIQVGLGDGRRLPAQILGVDKLTDIAVLKIEADGLKPLAFADSEKVRVGQIVLAVGSPFGLVESITMGIISARDRLFRSEAVTEYLQTDAAINRGNSGGPLVNLRGEIVGINNFIFAEAGGGSQGIGFSIPSNVVRRVVDQIVEHGRVFRPQLGVILAEKIDPALARQLGLPDTNGALVEAVFAGSPAQEAGLRRGDVILKFGGREVRTFNEVRKFVADGRIGEKTPVEVLRDGKKVELSVTLSEFEPRAALVPPVVPSAWLPVPPSAPMPQAPSVPVPSVANALSGVTVRAITPQLAARYRLPDGVAGVIVQSVAPGSPAAGALQPGDVIEQVNDDPVISPQEFAAVAAALPPDAQAVLLLSRGRVRSFEVVTP